MSKRVINKVMASVTKRTRKGSSSGFETVILKDLQCLQNWNLGQLHTYRLGQDYTSTVPSDCDRLLCNETLDDFDNVWATPVKSKRVKKSKAKMGSRLKSPEAYNLWSAPSKPQQKKKCKKKVGSGLKSQGACVHSSPASHWTVPPNSPADFTGPREQSRSNPYIAFLMHSWEEVQTPSDPLVSTHANKTAASRFSAIPDQNNVLLCHPNDALMICTSSVPDQLAAALTCSTDSNHRGNEDQVVMIQSNDVVVPDNTAATEEVPAFVHSLHSDDILVIPDNTAEEEVSTFFQHSIQQSATNTVNEQRVPGEEDLGQSGLHQSNRSQDDDEYFLYVEDDLLPLALTSQPTPCSLDHVVPQFHLEE